MPVFEYTALNAKGKNVSGIVDCESARVARQKLRATRIFPVTIKELSHPTKKTEKGSLPAFRPFARVSNSEITMMTRQIATLLTAGFPLVTAIDTLIKQTGSPAFQKIISRVKDSIEEGKSFAAALSDYPGTFSQVYINMIRAGEASGTLEIVLERLADISESQSALTSKIKAALVYPLFMAFIGTVVLFLLLTFVVPNMTTIFSDMGQTLPLPTRILIGTSDLLSTWWWIIALLFAGAIYGFTTFKKTEKGALMVDRFLLNLPIVGDLVTKLAVARFSRTLGSLLENGVSMMSALEVVKNVAGNIIISKTIAGATKEVEQGHELGVALSATKTFPFLCIQMIKVGEQSGELETMLNKVADVYEKEVEVSLVSMTALLEPTIILLMGVVVGFIVFSICLPIFEMNQLIK
ncbi:MAG: type II secretion system inner membrane protein GspF [Proteobacteria bacterium]|nr:type II secretion system inner membrane protein GspF [Pseudomonadota bacterium]